MSEHDANKALTDTARLRILPEPVEDAQLMTFSERQYRAREGRRAHDLATRGYYIEVEGTCPPRVSLTYVNSSPVNREPDFRDGQRERRLTAHEIAQQDGFPDNE
jgi:hypothetical protein